MRAIQKALAAGVIGLTSLSADFNNAVSYSSMVVSASSAAEQEFVFVPPTQEEMVQGALLEFNQDFANRVRNRDYSNPWNACFSTKAEPYDPSNIEPLRLSAPLKYAAAIKVLFGENIEPSYYSKLTTTSFFQKPLVAIEKPVYSKPIVLIDPGHAQSYAGGYEPGSMDASKKFNEVQAVDAIIAPLKTQLEERLGAIVVLTRQPVSKGITLKAHDSKFDNQQFVLQKRAEMASFLVNRFPDAEVVVASVHADDAGPYTSNSGGAVFYYDARSGASSENSRKLAQNISAHYRLRAGTSTSAEANDFAVLRCQYQETPSVLIELGFLSNPEDLARFKSAVGNYSVAYQIADGITKGIGGYLDSRRQKWDSNLQVASLDME